MIIELEYRKEYNEKKKCKTWKSLVKCERCQNERIVDKQNILNGFGVKFCKLCSNINTGKAVAFSKEFYSEFQQKTKIKPISQFPNSIRDYVNWICCVCNYEWHDNFMNIRRRQIYCPKCAGNLPKTIDDYVNLAKEKEIKFVGEVPKNSVTKTKWICKCGQPFDRTYDSIFSNNSKLCKECARKKSASDRIKDYSNIQFGSFIIKNSLGFESRGYRNVPIWIGVCKCGFEKEFPGYYITTGIKNGNMPFCPNCVELLYPGRGEIPPIIWERTIKGSKQRNLEFSITIADAWDQFLKQNRKCNLTGRILTFAKKYDKNDNFTQTASLDRINSDKGYIIENIQWLHKDINIMKNSFDQDYFI